MNNQDKWGAGNFSLVPSDSVCANCIHYGTAGNCDAFEVIPHAILYERATHDKPFPDQKNTIVFEQRPTL